jgi:hypothetical protein
MGVSPYNPATGVSANAASGCKGLAKGLTCSSPPFSIPWNRPDPTGSWFVRFTGYFETATGKGRPYVRLLGYTIKLNRQNPNVSASHLQIGAFCQGGVWPTGTLGCGNGGYPDPTLTRCPGSPKAGCTLPHKGVPKSGRLYKWLPPGWRGKWTSYVPDDAASALPFGQCGAFRVELKKGSKIISRDGRGDPYYTSDITTVCEGRVVPDINPWGSR